jgi:hypothetical protein
MGNREMRRCRNTVFALRDSRKTVSGGNFSICWVLLIFDFLRKHHFFTENTCFYTQRKDAGKDLAFPCIIHTFRQSPENKANAE